MNCPKCKKPLEGVWYPVGGWKNRTKKALLLSTGKLYCRKCKVTYLYSFILRQLTPMYRKGEGVYVQRSHEDKSS